VFVLTLFLLAQRKKGKYLFKAVRQSKDLGDYQYFTFSPDVDLLEVRTDNSIVGYELKGLQRAKKGMKPMSYYEGLGQALCYLTNPTCSPISDKVAVSASIFDYVYLVHPGQESIDSTQGDAFLSLVRNCTPIGLIYVSHDRWREVVPPKPNTFVNQELKDLFLQNLSAFTQYQKFRLSLVQ